MFQQDKAWKIRKGKKEQQTEQFEVESIRDDYNRSEAGDRKYINLEGDSPPPPAHMKTHRVRPSSK